MNILHGRNTNTPLEMTNEMTLVRKAAVSGNLCRGLSILEELPCFGDSQGDLIFVGRHAKLSLENTQNFESCQAHHLCQCVQVECRTILLVKTFAQLFDSGCSEIEWPSGWCSGTNELPGHYSYEFGQTRLQLHGGGLR